MNIFANIGAWILIPFIAVSGFFGMHGRVQWGPGPVRIAPITASMTSTVSLAHPIKPVNPPMQPVAPPAQGSVTIDSVSPTTGLAVGTTVTITGSGFTSDNKILLDGLVNTSDAQAASDSNGKQSLTFALTSSLAPDCQAGEACPMFVRLLTTGTYQLSVENANGDSNVIDVSITGAAPIQVQ